MSRYRFHPPPDGKLSAVDELVVIQTENGSCRAYLHAPDNAPPEALREVIERLDKKHWQCIPFSAEGKHALEVRGFSGDKSLLRALGVKGERVADTAEKEPSGWWEIIRKRSLQISGLLYLVGDLNFIKYGIKEKNPEDIKGGILYLLGTLVLVGFGRNDQADLQVREYAGALEKDLVKGNIRIPSSCALYSVADDSDLNAAHKAYNWARSHPAELFNTIYIGAGSMIAASALRRKIFKSFPGESAKDRLSRKIAGWMDFTLGATTASVSLAGNVIEERKPEPDDPPPRNFTEKAWNWIREKPLRLTGYGLMASTLCHAGSTGLEYMRAKRANDQKTLSAVLNRATFVGTNIAAEGLVALSSKGHGEGVVTDESVKDSVYALAAEMIVRQPEKEREELVKHLTEFLHRPHLLAEPRETVEVKLREEINGLENNPWLRAENAPIVSAAPVIVPAKTPLPETRIHVGAMQGASPPVLVQAV